MICIFAGKSAVAASCSVASSLDDCKTFQSGSFPWLAIPVEVSDGVNANCDTVGEGYYKDITNKKCYIVNSCTKCKDGSQPVMRVTSNYTCSLYYLSCSCPACTDCESDLDWVTISDGYQKREIRECDCGVCNVVLTGYQCAPGYWGKTSDGETGCEPCPVGGTSAGGSESISECYIAADTSIPDAVGKYTYTSDCYYTE